VKNKLAEIRQGIQRAQAIKAAQIHPASFTYTRLRVRRAA